MVKSPGPSEHNGDARWRKTMAKLTKPARDRISATKLAFPKQTEGAAGKRLSRTQRGCALPPGEGRYGSGTSGGVEADTVCRKAIWSRTNRVRRARTRHGARLPRQRNCSTLDI